ncbi:MAG: 5-(carboxyamino)imidazole ribonucleotide mutase [Thermoleophilia bacterium]
MPDIIEELEPMLQEMDFGSVLVGVVMGSESDREVMQAAVDELKRTGIPHEVSVISAHRDPKKLAAYAEGAAGRGLKIIIAGAGKAAALPGVIASLTSLPVIGVPIQTKELGGMDSLLSIVQMPPGVPVACMAINGATNAAIMAARILAVV